MRIFKLSFDTTEDANDARNFLDAAGIQTRRLSEGFEFVILERSNPDWEFSTSTLRLIIFNMQSYKLKRIEVSVDE